MRGLFSCTTTSRTSSGEAFCCSTIQRSSQLRCLVAEGHICRAHGYLSQVDEATSYHVLSYMRDRLEEETMCFLVNGWFSYFGPPDDMMLASDGSVRGFRFETLQAQCAVKVRYAPADAHYQMGKVERHGQSIRYIVQRLVSQFAPLAPEELNVIVMMSVNSLTTSTSSLTRPSSTVSGAMSCHSSSPTEQMAKRLLQSRDFRTSSVHQLLDAMPRPTKENAAQGENAI